MKHGWVMNSPVLESPIVVITGASRGIGKAMALAMGKASCKDDLHKDIVAGLCKSLAKGTDISINSPKDLLYTFHRGSCSASVHVSGAHINHGMHTSFTIQLNLGLPASFSGVHSTILNFLVSFTVLNISGLDLVHLSGLFGPEPCCYHGPVVSTTKYAAACELIEHSKDTNMLKLNAISNIFVDEAPNPIEAANSNTTKHGSSALNSRGKKSVSSSRDSSI